MPTPARRTVLIIKVAVTAISGDIQDVREDGTHAGEAPASRLPRADQAARGLSKGGLRAGEGGPGLQQETTERLKAT